MMNKESNTQKTKNARDNKEHNKKHHHQEQDDNKYNVTCKKDIVAGVSVFLG